MARQPARKHPRLEARPAALEPQHVPLAPHAHRHGTPVDGPCPQRLPGLPRARDAHRHAGDARRQVDGQLGPATHLVDIDPLAAKEHRPVRAQAPGMRPQPSRQVVEPPPLHEFAGPRRRHQHPRRLLVGLHGREAVRKLLGDEVGRQRPGLPARMRHQRRQEADIVLDSGDLEPVERLLHRRDGRPARRRVRHQLGDHRVVEHRDFRALDHAGVDPHGGALRRALGGRGVARQAPDGGQEAAQRILGIDAALDRPARQAHIVLGQRQRLARGDADHLFHEVHPGDELGHRVLHLQAGVHLEEVEALVLSDDELHRTGGIVVHRLCQRDRLRAHARPRLGIEQRRRRLLDDLLVAPLDRAFPLAQMDAVAVLVAQNLDLDVARVLDELLDEQPVVAKGGSGLRARPLEALAHLVGIPGDAHALAAAARRRLDHHRIADLLGDADRLVGVLEDAQIARHRGDARRRGHLLRGDLVAHRLDGTGVGADEGDALGLQPLGEGRTFRQEAVARMHRVGPGCLAGRHDGVDHEVGLRRRRRPDAHRLVGHPHVQRVGVGIGVHGHGADAHGPGGLDDATRDFAAIGNQNGVEHARAPGYWNRPFLRARTMPGNLTERL